MTNVTVSTALVATKQVKVFLASLALSDQNTILHELSLIADGYSVEFAPVRNDVIYNWCLSHGLQEPQRFKLFTASTMERGGIRVIFAFSQDDKPRLLYMIKADFRNNDPYGDGK